VRGPATMKAPSPSDERRVAGTTRADDDADCVREYNYLLLLFIFPFLYGGLFVTNITTGDLLGQS